MRAHEFIRLAEAIVPMEFKKILSKKGYKHFGSGADQQAFLEPGTGLIVKIFGTEKGSDSKSGISKSQKSFADFANYCRKNPDNPFLPNFTNWGSFVFKGQTYLQIHMERLFPFTGKVKSWGYALSVIADEAERVPNPVKGIDRLVSRAYSRDIIEQLVMHMGKEAIYQLWTTIYELGQIAKKNRYILDLHSKNFMLGSDGHIVISDPFWIDTSDSVPFNLSAAWSAKEKKKANKKANNFASNDPDSETEITAVAGAGFEDDPEQYHDRNAY